MRGKAFNLSSFSLPGYVFENSNERLRGETSIEFTREVGRRVNLNLLVRPYGHAPSTHMRRHLHKAASNAIYLYIYIYIYIYLRVCTYMRVILNSFS